MAEAFLNDLSRGSILAESAGLEPGILNKRVVQVMKEIGIDISQNRTKGVFDIIKMGRSYDFVITVCDEQAEERCPVFPGKSTRLHWSFPDPSSFTGEEGEILEKTRKVRDNIKKRIEQFIEEIVL